MPLFSIIIPVFNRESYLDRSIESVINQTFGDWEIGIVDDGSTDNSYEICKRYSELDKRIRVFKQDNAGPGAARNTGIENAKGDYIMFLDSDDWYENDCLERCEKAIRESHPDIITFFMKEWHKDGERINKRSLLPGEMTLEEKKKFLMPRDISVGTRACKREMINEWKIRFPNWPTSEDVCFMLLCYGVANSIMQLPATFYNYDKRLSVSATHYDGGLESFMIRIPFLAKEEFENRGIYQKFKYVLAKAFLEEIKYAIVLSKGDKKRIEAIKKLYSKMADELYPDFGEMVLKKYLVIGSYTLRSAVQTLLLDVNDINHYQFHSLISLTQNEQELNIRHANLYRENMLKKGVNKFFFNDIKECQYDFIVFDLLEERFDLVSDDKSIMTYSDALAELNIDKDEHIKKISRHDESIFSGFEKALAILKDYVEKYDAAHKLVLVENYLCEKKGRYFGEENFADLERIAMINFALKKYYELFKKTFPTIIIVNPYKRCEAFSDDSYRHGCEPSHTSEAWESYVGELVFGAIKDN